MNNSTNNVCPTCGRPFNTTNSTHQALKNVGFNVCDITINATMPKDIDDPIYNSLLKGNTIKSPKLYRRWVASQMFHMLSTGDFTKALRNKGYIYQWHMILEELNAQVHMERNGDIESLKKRQMFFNRNSIAEMADDYVRQLANEYRRRHAKYPNGSYVKFRGEKYFHSEMTDRILPAFRNIAYQMCEARSVAELHRLVEVFVAKAKSIYFTSMQGELKMSAKFVDCYKGAGAYYTLQNLILFSGVTFNFPNGWTLSDGAAMEWLDKKAEWFMQDEAGYKLLGILKQTLTNNNIDINTKLQQWRKK